MSPGISNAGDWDSWRNLAKGFLEWRGEVCREIQEVVGDGLVVSTFRLPLPHVCRLIQLPSCCCVFLHVHLLLSLAICRAHVCVASLLPAAPCLRHSVSGLCLQSAPKQRNHHTKLTVKLKTPASPPILFLLGASFLKQEKRNPPKNLGKACSGMPSEAKSAVGLICTSITESI